MRSISIRASVPTISARFGVAARFVVFSNACAPDANSIKIEVCPSTPVNAFVLRAVIRLGVPRTIDENETG